MTNKTVDPVDLCELRIERRRAQLQRDWEEAEPKDDGFHETLIAKDYAQSLLNGLPQRVRPIAWLAFVDGLCQDDIARELGLSRRTVTSRMRELRVRMNALSARAETERAPPAPCINHKARREREN